MPGLSDQWYAGATPLCSESLSRFCDIASIHQVSPKSPVNVFESWKSHRDGWFIVIEHPRNATQDQYVESLNETSCERVYPDNWEILSECRPSGSREKEDAVLPRRIFEGGRGTAREVSLVKAPLLSICLLQKPVACKASIEATGSLHLSSEKPLTFDQIADYPSTCRLNHTLC